MNIRGTTKIIGIIGCPVKHSLSPLMQNEALRACGLDFIFVPFHVEPQDLVTAVAGMKALGVAGFNVTIPHKTAVIPFLDALDESAEVAGAVNTVKSENGTLIGYNTDGDGLVRSLDNDLGFDPNGRTIVVIGSGGASRGAVASLCRSGAHRIVLVNRSHDKAEQLVSTFSGRYPGTVLSALNGYEELPNHLSDADLLINTTSLGMNNEHIPHVSLESMSSSAKIYDMVYSPSITPLLAEASLAGLTCCNGLGMLSAQGELAFTIWTGVTPPFGLMKSVLEGICSN
jgi:shikimate dehydrogenase